MAAGRRGGHAPDGRRRAVARAGGVATAHTEVAGSGFSLSADQQLTTGLLWFVSACAFIPVVYWNLIRWLQAEEDPDEELHHLVRQERIRGRTLGPGQPTP